MWLFFELRKLCQRNSLSQWSFHNLSNTTLDYWYILAFLKGIEYKFRFDAQSRLLREREALTCAQTLAISWLPLQSHHVPYDWTLCRPWPTRCDSERTSYTQRPLVVLAQGACLMRLRERGISVIIPLYNVHVTDKSSITAHRNGLPIGGGNTVLRPLAK